MSAVLAKGSQLLAGRPKILLVKNERLMALRRYAASP
jgi:hypothetical protein